MTEPAPASLSRPQRWFLWAGIALAAFWGLGQLGRESLWPAGILFSVLPSPLVVLTTASAALSAWHSGRRCTAAVAFVLALPPLLSVAWLENAWTTRAASPRDRAAAAPLTVVHWNVARGALGWTAAQQILRTQAADFYLLSEPPPDADPRVTASLLGADMAAAALPQMTALGHGEVTVVAARTFEGAASGLLRWRWHERTLRVLAVDLPPNQLRPRAPLLDWIARQIAMDAPDFVLGDFNTPRRAIQPLPAGYVHAYDAAGSGWSYTWPMLCPLWAIDQALVGPRVRALRYDLVTTVHSDHRLQRLVLAIDRAPITASQARP